MRPSADEYIRLVRAAQALNPAETVEKEEVRQTLYNQAHQEGQRLVEAGWTIQELALALRHSDRARRNED